MLKKNKWLLLFALALIFASCGDNDQGGAKSKLSGKTAAAYFAANDINIGWNAGNALDGPDETAWLSPDNFVDISLEMLKGVRDTGFSVIRIPVTWHLDRGSNNRWSRIIGPAPDYKLNETRLNRVVEVVDMAYEAGFKAVIINIHHDGDPGKDGTVRYGSTQPNMFWLDMNGGNDVTEKLKKVWEQIAVRFKDYGDWLIFEGFNEPRKDNSSWGWGEIVDADMAKINEWNQAFTDAVRAVGGCNTHRFLVIQPYAARVHLAIDERFKMPTDPTSGKQIVSIHWYYPADLCGTNNATSFTWGSEADKDLIINGKQGNPNNTGGVGFKQFKEKYSSKGIPVIIGECGASNQEGASNSVRDEDQKAAADASRLAFLTYLCAQAKEHGLVPIIWDNGYNIRPNSTGDAFGLLDRKTGKPLRDKEDELVKAMINAAGK